MAPRKHNEKASWEVDADKPKPQGETRARRSYCVKELVTSESSLAWTPESPLGHLMR